MTVEQPDGYNVSTDMNRIPRRSFLGRASVAIAGVGTIGFPQIISSRVLGASYSQPSAKDRLNIAHIGVGGMGSGHLGYMLARQSRGDVNVVAVCDVDENRL
ncbi:MAG: twin-arginine translocation signal domain-containing protein, partial [Verrucomicrobiota bacterium]|nr:twin-arginine translocation signal domain-containing protein [Verrucomicrobiota bacterium]